MKKTADPAGPRPLRRDAEANRLRILNAAGRVFAERGLAVPMEEIAAAAGLGVGTLYRRFPDRHHLIDALFEERLGAIAALGDESLQFEDGWDGLVWFLENALARQIDDRGLAEIMLGHGDLGDRLESTRGRFVAIADQLVGRARASGRLRPDFEPTDLAMLQVMISAVGAATADAAPQVWRRYLVLMLDGMTGSRDQPTAQAVAPLTAEAVNQAMRLSRLGQARAARRAEPAGSAGDPRVPQHEPGPRT